MTRIRFRWAAALSLAIVLPAGAAHADPWWVVKPRPGPTAVPSASLGRPVPAASLDKPVAASEPAVETGWNPGPAPVVEAGWNTPSAPVAPPASTEGWDRKATPASYDVAPDGSMPPRLVRGQPADPAPPGALTGPPPAPPPTPTLGDPGLTVGVPVDQPMHHPFCQGVKEWLNCGGRPSTGEGLFKSDHFCDDSLISPVTNPFYFEDPRALTEVKPLFIIQHAPSDHGGGTDEFFGLQGRLAFSDRFSLVLNKFGFVSLNPDKANAGYDKKTGFAEIDFGPKFTFWRDENLRGAAAVGLTIEAPVGSKSVYQDTGTLGLDPYITYGQSFGRSSYGSFNFIGELGYNFAVDNERSEFLHTSFHLDYDVLNAHRWYPLLEMNYFYYTKSGRHTGLNGFDGTDLVNFGSTNVGKRDLLTLAPGFRYRFNDHIQAGAAVEFPISTQKDLEAYRFTFDLIFRY